LGRVSLGRIPRRIINPHKHKRTSCRPAAYNQKDDSRRSGRVSLDTDWEPRDPARSYNKEKIICPIRQAILHVYFNADPTVDALDLFGIQFNQQVVDFRPCGRGNRRLRDAWRIGISRDFINFVIRGLQLKQAD
jgi:hypothetical protein